MTELPSKIAALVAGKPYVADSIGMSGDELRLYPDTVLKISRDDGEARREAQILSWLQGRLPVPEVVACVREGGRQYLLMTRLAGKMLCDRAVISDPHNAAQLLAQALELLRSVPAGECPFTCTLAEKLQMARGFVERGEVDVDNTEPETFGPGGFRSPEALLYWLEDNRPEEELIFTHGDMSLPNIFCDNNKITGFLDLGKAGLADRYQDLAIARRSLLHNTNGGYGFTAPGFDPDVLFKYLDVTPDRDKLRYYTLLDELF